MQTRNTSADILKCLAIYGVVFIHGAFLLGGDSPYLQWINSIFRASVPVFIIIWAYFFELALLKGVSCLKYSLARIRHLLVVFALWSLLYYFLNPGWPDISFSSAITKYWSGYGWSGQYFFVVLVQLTLVFFLLRKIYDNRVAFILTLMGCLALTFVYGYWYPGLSSFIKSLGDRPFIFWIIYVFIGIYLARQPGFYIPWKWSWLLLCIPLEFFILSKLNHEHSAYITPAVLIGSSVFAFGMLNYPLGLNNSKMANVIKFVSENTMTVFLLNPLVVIILEPVTASIRTAHHDKWSGIFKGIISGILVLFFCLLAAFSINKTKLKGIIN